MSQVTAKQITARQILADQVSALGSGAVADQYPDFIFSFGSNDARVLEQFSGASTSAMGSTTTNLFGDPQPSITYSGGAFTLPAENANVKWTKAAIEGFSGGTFRPIVTGFTLQVEVSSAAFATTASTGTVGFLAYLGGTTAGSSLTINHTNSTKSWAATQVDGTNAAESTPTVQTENVASQAFDIITISYHGSAAGSDEGLLVVARNGSIILKQEPTNAAILNGDFYIGGLGAYGFNNLSYPMRNVMLISGPTVFPANVKICYMGDSNAAYPDYSLTSSLNPNHNPPLIVRGYEGTAAANTNYADPGTVTSLPKFPSNSNQFQFFDQNLRCLLTGKLAARGLSPAGGKILSSSRGGCQIYDWAGDGTHNDLIQRCDALYANDTHSYAVYPPDVLGSSHSVDTFIINLGGNDMTRIAAAGGLTSGRKTTLLNAYKARIDELVSGSSPNQILLLGVFPAYTFGKPNIPAEEITPALRGEMNAAISELNGYAGVCEYVSVDNFPIAALIGLDGVHFSVLGQEFIAELLASRIKL
jgi:hypothetical protein